MKQRIRATKFVTMLLSGAAIGVLSAPAYAQDDQIIVTATKRAQTLQEVPVAVSVVDAQVIEDAQIIDIIDLQASVPSLRVGQLQNSSQTNFIIRGFGNGANNPGIEAAVGVFVDGVYRSRVSSSILDLPTLERAEVLRGPQSTLFGKNVSVGAITLTTKKPSYEWEGSAEATYGNLETVRFRGTLSGPISETLAFRVSGSTNNRGGTYTNLVDGSDNINERDRWSARTQLLWEPSDVLSFRAIGEYNRINEVCCGATLLFEGPATTVIGAPIAFGGLGQVIPPANQLNDRLVAVDELPVNEIEGKGVSLQADWDLGFGQVTSITSYNETDDFNQTDVDFSGARIAEQPQELNQQTFTQELRIAGVSETGIGTFNWLGGAFYFQEDVAFFRDVINGDDTRPFINALLMGLGTDLVTGVEGGSQIAAALTGGPTAVFPQLGAQAPIGFGASFAPGTGVEGDYTLDNRSYSIFGQVDWDITDRLTITGGLSYVNDRKIATGTSILNDPVSNFDFTSGGQALVAAGVLGGLVPGAFGGPIAFDPANPFPFFGAVGAWAAGDPASFGAAQAGALAFAQDPTNAALNPLAPLSAIQFFQPQVNFPNGAASDDQNSLLDDGRVVDDDITVTARIAYDVSDNLNVYFNYGTGFKASAVNLSSDSAPPAIGPDGSTIIGRFAEPEEVTSFEIGLKTSFNGGFINIALFDQSVQNFQQNLFIGTGFTLINAGEQSVRGFEVDAAYSPVDPLQLTFALTYLDPEFDSFVNAPCSNFIEGTPAACLAGAEFFDASGFRPTGIAPVSISTSAAYTKDFANGAAATLRVEYYFESETQVVPNVPTSVASRTVNELNANLRYEMENGFSVNLFGRNLTDDDYLISAFPTVVQTGSFSGYVNTPRTFGISVKKDF